MSQLARKGRWFRAVQQLNSPTFFFCSNRPLRTLCLSFHPPSVVRPEALSERGPQCADAVRGQPVAGAVGLRPAGASCPASTTLRRGARRVRREHVLVVLGFHGCCFRAHLSPAFYFFAAHSNQHKQFGLCCVCFTCVS